jgi:hypothetical protein
MNQVWAPIFKETGMDSLSYIPKSQPMKRDDWPTLGEMIKSGRRVVTFMDAHADRKDDTVNYIIPEFPHVSFQSSLATLTPFSSCLSFPPERVD